MSENYFTGKVKNTSQQQPATNQTQQSTQQKAQTLQEQVQSLNINEETKKQSNDHQNLETVNIEEVTVEKQEIEEEKFIESNPTIAAEHKQQGNQKYTSGQYSQALSSYRKALQYKDKESQQDKKFRSIIYSNIGLTYMKMCHDDSAIEYFQNSLKLVRCLWYRQNQKYTKARSNLAQCYENTDKIQEALDQYKKVLQINPNDAYVKQKVVPLEIKVKQLQQKRQQQVMSGLKNIGNSILGYFGMSLDNFKLQKGAGGGYNVQFKQ